MADFGEAKILIVEDDEGLSRILERRLTKDGFQVSCASDGRDGMKSIVALEPDLVISDWMMPHVDGLELCQSVKTGLGEAAPYFILLTAKDDLNDRLVALQTGADDYIVKPVKHEELLTRIRNGFRYLALRRELKRTPAQLEAISVELDQSRRPQAIGHLTLCSGCGKVQTADGLWQDVARCAEDAGVAEFDRATCPDCLGRTSDAASRGSLED